MSATKKRQIITLLIFIGTLIALLAVSLSSIQMQEGSNFVLEAPAEAEDISRPDPDTLFFVYRMLQGLLVIMLIAFGVYLVISLFDKEGRKKLLKQIILLTALILVLVWLSENQPYQQLEMVETEQPAAILAPPEDEPEIISTPVAFTPSPNPWLFPLMIVGLAILISVTAYLALSLLRNRPADQPGAFDVLADRAQQAIDDIEEAKVEFKDVIFRCYYEMNQVLKTEKSITRNQELTPHEFREVLLGRGFPARPVSRLTNLFEQARYGRQQLWDQERQIAIESLSEVVDFCRGRS